MAQQVKVVLVDDLDGGKADETVSFAVDGSSYEIDLSTKNAGKMRDALATYVASARKSAGRRSRGASRRAVPNNRERASEIRAWAKSRNLKVNERGRIPADVVAKYDAAN